MAVLLGIGLAHSFLLWWGDILVPYAICGFLLLPFRDRSQRAIFIWAQIMYWFVIVLFAGFYIATLFGGGADAAGPEHESAGDDRCVCPRQRSPRSSAMRAQEWAAVNSFVFFLTRILGIFLFGLYIWRQGYLRQPAEHLGWWRAAQKIGLSLRARRQRRSCVAIEWVWHPNPMQPTPLTRSFFSRCSRSRCPRSAWATLSTIVLLWQNPVWQRRLMPFSYVGRMALTNYLLQSLICTTIFYSYGLGLYGRVGPLADLFIGIVIYGLQIPFSRWWLSTPPLRADGMGLAAADAYGRRVRVTRSVTTTSSAAL